LLPNAGRTDNTQGPHWVIERTRSRGKALRLGQCNGFGAATG
jgi:hypothetical protein